MNILIVEDNDIKYEAIRKTIADDCLISDTDITRCESINSCKKKLKEAQFSVLILDIQIPTYDHESPCQTGGIQLLEFITSSDRVHKPLSIIGITAYDNLYTQALPNFQKYLFSIIIYNQADDSWKRSLIAHIQYISSKKEMDDQEDFDYDLGIICALEKTELSKVLELSPSWSIEENESDSTIFHTTTWTINGNTYKIVAAAGPQMGMVSSAVLASKLIRSFKPKYIAMTGICAGLKERVKIGDILICDPSWDYSTGKLTTNDKQELSFQSDIRQDRLDPKLQNLFQYCTASDLFCNEIYATSHFNRPQEKPRAHLGPIASGPFVISNTQILEIIKKQSRKLLGIEMEIAGIMYASNNFSETKPKSFAIKTVSDYADAEKGDNYQDHAAFCSAQYLYMFFSKFLA